MINPFNNKGLSKTEIHITDFFCMLILLLITWLGSCIWIEHLALLYIITGTSYFYLFIFRWNHGHENHPMFTCFLLLAVLSMIGYFNYFAALERNSLFSSKLRFTDHISFLPSSIKAPIFSDNPAIAFIRWETYAMAGSVFLRSMLSEKRRFFLLMFFSLNVALMGIWAIYNLKFGTNCVLGALYSQSTVYGTFFSENAAGSFLGMGLTITLFLFVKSCKVSYKIFFALVASIIAISMIINNSNGSKIECILISTIAGIAYLTKINCAMRTKAFLIFFIISTIIAGMLFWFSNSYYYGNNLLQMLIDSTRSRINIYQISLSVFLKKPVFGCGEGSFSILASPYYQSILNEAGNKTTTALLHAHSDLIDMLVKYGISGCFIAIFFVFKLYKKLLPLIKSPSGIIIYFGSLLCLLKACVDIGFSIPSIGVGWLFLVSAAYAETCKNDIDNKFWTQIQLLFRKRINLTVIWCFFLIGSGYTLLEYSTSLIPEEKSIRFEILKSAAEFNDIREVKRQYEKLKNTEYSNEAKKILALSMRKEFPEEDEVAVTFNIIRKLKSVDKKELTKNDINSIYFMKPSEIKIRAITELLKRNDIPENMYKQLVDKAKIECLKNKFQHQQYAEVISKILLQRGDFNSAFFFIDLINCGLANRTLSLYSICGNAISIKKIKSSQDHLKNDESTKKIWRYATLAAKLSIEKKYDDIIKQLRFVGYQYGMDRYISSEESCLPIYVYIFSKTKNTSLHSKYKNKMLSSKTLKRASGKYITYCETSCKVLALENDTKAIISLLETLNNRSQKMHVLKYCIADLTSNRNSIKAIADYLDN